MRNKSWNNFFSSKFPDIDTEFYQQTVQKMKFYVKDFISECEQILRKLGKSGEITIFSLRKNTAQKKNLRIKDFLSK